MSVTADATLIGLVRDVRGASVAVELTSESAVGLTFVDGYGYRIGQIGSFVKIPVGFVDLFGVVSQVGANAVPDPLRDVSPHGALWMSVQLIGEARRGGRFERGLGQYPTVGDPVHLVADADLGRLYGRRAEPGLSVRIGSVASAESIAAEIGVNPHYSTCGRTGQHRSGEVDHGGKAA